MASVTVGIPAYNSASFLAETLQSALDQSDPPESIIVVDDESPDDSFAVAKKWPPRTRQFRWSGAGTAGPVRPGIRGWVNPNQGIKNRLTNSSAHFRALELTIGPKGASPDPVLYKRARRKWLARYGYGQHMTALGTIRQGRFKEVIPAACLALAGYWARIGQAEWHPKR